jgi:hypothetical protein
MSRPATLPTPLHVTSTETSRAGAAHATSWDRPHPRLTRPHHRRHAHDRPSDGLLLVPYRVLRIGRWGHWPGFTIPVGRAGGVRFTSPCGPFGPIT